MLDISLIHRKEYELGADRSCPVVVAEAPGRLHYLGEHGEPGAGLYLSSAVDRSMRVAVSPRNDASLRFYAADLGERRRTTLANLKFKREDRWANYIKASITMFIGLGCPVKGLNFTAAGNIPQQTGLASSTALEVAAAVALKGLFHVTLGEKDLARRLAASRAAFFGKDPGVVDYLAILAAKKDQFVVVDEAAATARRVKAPLKGCRLLLLDSRVPRMGVASELRLRLNDLKKGLDLLSRGRPGARFRDFAASDLMEAAGLPEDARRRSLHVTRELRRITQAEEALAAGDLAAFARIVYHSHESLRDLYEVSCPEIDWLVKRAQETAGALGARMAGEGFGGCAYLFIKEEAVEEYRKRLEDYERIFQFHPVVHEMRLGTGARLLPRG